MLLGSSVPLIPGLRAQGHRANSFRVWGQGAHAAGLPGLRLFTGSLQQLHVSSCAPVRTPALWKFFRTETSGSWPQHRSSGTRMVETGGLALPPLTGTEVPGCKCGLLQAGIRARGHEVSHHQRPGHGRSGRARLPPLILLWVAGLPGLSSSLPIRPHGGGGLCVLTSPAAPGATWPPQPLAGEGAEQKQLPSSPCSWQ